MASIDGAPFSDSYLTRMRQGLIGHATMGVEASNELHAFAYSFQKKLENAKRGVNMASPEAMSFRKAWETLKAEFSAFTDLMVLSNPEELREMAGRTGEFLRKLARLPAVGKPRKAPPPQVVQDQTNILADPRGEYAQ